MIAIPSRSDTEFGQTINDYRAKGLKVLPLEGKTPRVKNWPNLDFTTDEIGAKLAGYAEPAIGVQMGPKSGIIDFEYDTLAQFARIRELFGGDLPLCPAFASKHGGHFIFAWDERLEGTNAGNLYIPCDNGEKLVVRIGAAGKGSQSAFPPSPGKTWLPGRSILEIDPPALHEDIIAKLLECAQPAPVEVVPDPDWEATPEQVERCREALEALPDAVEGEGLGGGGRTINAACEIRRHHIYNEQGYELLQWYNDNKCYPPWDEKDLARKWEEAKKFERPACAEFEAVEVPLDFLGTSEQGPTETTHTSDKSAPTKRRPVKKFTLGQLRAGFPGLNPPVVNGLFRSAETANLISVSKAGKSWMVYGLAISIITGRPWLGRFSTSAGKVLLIDNELHPSVLASRVPRVCDAMGIPLASVENQLEVWPLRGNLRSLNDLAIELESTEPGAFKAIILDAKYRFAKAGESENDNSAETVFYNTVDRIAERTGAAIVLVHHSSKGEQSGKRVTDVGSGAGAQSRATDCHIVLREHEEDGVFVLEAAVRSFAPVDPIALRWEFPLWVPEVGVDTGKLKGNKTRGEERQIERDREGIDQILETLGKDPATARELREATGYGKDRLGRLLKRMISQDQITAESVVVKGNECKQYHIKRPEI